jgi:hypothetical protein
MITLREDFPFERDSLDKENAKTMRISFSSSKANGFPNGPFGLL